VKGADAGTLGKMPKYVTESGYEEFEDVRTRVGRNDPLPQTLWLAEVATGKVRELKFDALPGIATDPLAALRKAAGKEALKGNRAVQVATSGDNGSAPSLLWSNDGRNAAVMVRAIDNKDRWIASGRSCNATLQPRHRLTDPAWINWGFNEFGWLADGRTLWYLSEESGFSHLYTLRRHEQDASLPMASGKLRRRRERRAMATSFCSCATARSRATTKSAPWTARGGQVREVTSLDGVESFVPSPDGRQLLVRIRPRTCRRSCRWSMRRRRSAATHRHPHRRLQGARSGSSRSRAGAQQARRRHHLGQVSTGRRRWSRAGNTRW
jgi:hypothetical protein